MNGLGCLSCLKDNLARQHQEGSGHNRAKYLYLLGFSLGRILAKGVPDTNHLIFIVFLFFGWLEMRYFG